ncbi:hypothetical protein L226DRAFT_569965 [Lentinus tigrinus ALCF2SS1-7]|uniref:uncharacterized protein n=1 Tax=Lentinus tigrinus ALCF2SS1-7 TaxID=1328758 RepID=UPI001165EC81|nr:hypothetical protein L226DRAFT_569965 [Lentinus tigrinus ALCF2SS1-7]
MVKHFVNVSPDLAHVLYCDIVIGQLVRVIGTLEYSHSTSKDIYVCTSALPEEVDDDLLKTHDLLAATFHMMVTSNAQTIRKWFLVRSLYMLSGTTPPWMHPSECTEHMKNEGNKILLTHLEALRQGTCWQGVPALKVVRSATADLKDRGLFSIELIASVVQDNLNGGCWCEFYNDSHCIFWRMGRWVY